MAPTAEEHTVTPLDASQNPVADESHAADEDSSDWDPEEAFWEDPLLSRDDDTHTKHEVNTLREYLSDGSLDPAIWAPRFWSAREDELPLDCFDLRMWNLLRAAITRLVRKQERIMDLLLAIHQMDPDSMGWTDAQKVRFPNWRSWTNVEDMVMWRIRDDRNADWASRYDELDRDERVLKLHAIGNISRFFAIWSGRYTGWTDLTRGVFIIRDALERDPPGQDFDDTSTPERIGMIIDAHIRAGAQYIMHAGHWIYGCSYSPGIASILFAPDAEADEGDKRCIWHGPPGFTDERWDFWRERLTELREHPHILDSTRFFIDVSITAMWMAEQKVEEKGDRVYTEWTPESDD